MDHWLHARTRLSDGSDTSNATYGNFYRLEPAAWQQRRRRFAHDQHDDSLWDLDDYFAKRGSRLVTDYRYASNGAGGISDSPALLADPPSQWPENLHSYGYSYGYGYGSDATPRHYTDMTRPVELDTSGPSTLAWPSLPFVTPAARLGATEEAGAWHSPVSFRRPIPPLLGHAGCRFPTALPARAPGWGV